MRISAVRACFSVAKRDLARLPHDSPLRILEWRVLFVEESVKPPHPFRVALSRQREAVTLISQVEIAFMFEEQNRRPYGTSPE
jgi:hypothetical protein